MLWHSMQSGGLWKLAQLTRLAAKHTRSLSAAVASGVIVSPEPTQRCIASCIVQIYLSKGQGRLSFNMLVQEPKQLFAACVLERLPVRAASI